MIERLYVNNFRCFENFSIDLVDHSSALVIGNNGVGKSTFLNALAVLQSIGRGSGRAKELIGRSDFTQERTDIPMRFEIDLKLAAKHFKYTISFDFPSNFEEARVVEESLFVDGYEIFSRVQAQVNITDGGAFRVDWHVLALPVINEPQGQTSIQQVKSFLGSLILIAPIPATMSGFSEEDSVELKHDASNFSSWFNALLSRFPAAYSDLYDYLKHSIPDLSSFENVPRGESGKQLLVKFKRDESNQVLQLEFKQLSDGEKCFFLSALILAASRASGPVVCVWDEPDNHLSLQDVGQFVTQLRKMTNQDGQLIVTSHHPETIRKFSDETTFVFSKESHLEPTVVQKLADLPYNGDLIEAIVRDEIVQ
jgi:predicted ATPase